MGQARTPASDPNLRAEKMGRSFIEIESPTHATDIYIYIYIYIYTHTYMHTYIHIYIYIYI